jgi:hypothetical protein
MARIEERLSAMGLVLPALLTTPAGRLPFTMARIVGARVLIAGHGPLKPDGTPGRALQAGENGEAGQPRRGVGFGGADLAPDLAERRAPTPAPPSAWPNCRSTSRSRSKRRLRSRARACRFQTEAPSAVIASDSEAIQTKPPPQSPSLDCFALLAMTKWRIRLECIMR